MKEKKQKLIDITTVKFLLVGVINTLLEQEQCLDYIIVLAAVIGCRVPEII